MSDGSSHRNLTSCHHAACAAVEETSGAASSLNTFQTGGASNESVEWQSFGRKAQENCQTCAREGYAPCVGHVSLATVSGWFLASNLRGFPHCSMIDWP